MKITICGSIAFFDEMLSTKRELESHGHEVEVPPTEIVDETGGTMSIKEYYLLRKEPQIDESWIWARKKEAMLSHFAKVAWADAILVLNYTKNGIPYYIGANTLLEMGLAFYQRKEIFLLNPIPEITYKEEILGMDPIIVGESFAERFQPAASIEMVKRAFLR